MQSLPAFLELHHHISNVTFLRTIDVPSFQPSYTTSRWAMLDVFVAWNGADWMRSRYAALTLETDAERNRSWFYFHSGPVRKG